MKAYTQLGPSTPYMIRRDNTFATGDFDGDGRVEIASYCPTNNSLNILSYFAYADASPGWASATEGMLINAWACTQSVPANSNNTAAASWTLRSDDQYFAAKVTGTTDFIAIFNPSQLQVGLLQWSGQQMQTAFVSQTGQLSGGVGLNSADRFFAADINGDHCDEIVLFSPNDLYLIVLNWNTGTSQLQADPSCTSSHITVAGWTMASSDIYIKGRCYGTADQIVAFKPFMGIITLFYPSEDTLLAYPASSVDFPYGNPSILTADVDGDGYDEVVVYGNDGKGTDPFQVLILKWSQSQSTFIKLMAPTPVGYLVGLWHPRISFLSQIGKIAGLVSFNTQNNSLSLYVAIPEGKPTALISPWTGTTPIIGQNASLTTTETVSDGNALVMSIVVSYGPSTMGLNSADRFWVADVDGDGEDELVMFSPNDEWLFIIKWDGSALAPCAAAQTALLGWSVDLLLQAPSTPFTQVQFTGNQQTIYGNISTQLYSVVESKCPISDQSNIRGCYSCLAASDFVALLGQLKSIAKPDPDTQAVAAVLSNEFMYTYISDSLDPSPGPDVRATYVNVTSNAQIEFSSWAQQLANMPPMQNADVTAWKTLANQLIGEFKGVYPVSQWGGADCMGAVNDRIKALKNEAFDDASGWVNQNYTPGESTAVYWTEAIIGALIWGVAAVGELGSPMQVILAMSASLFGSVASYGSSGSSQNLSFSQIQALIQADYLAAQDKLANQCATIKSDQVLLPLLGGLFDGQGDNGLWVVNDWDLADFSSGETAVTIQYYATLIPLRFQFIVWQNTTYQTPYYLEWGGPKIGYVFKQLYPAPPTFAYRAEPAGRGTWNIYLLCSSNDPSQQLSYPVQGLFDDLTNNLGVSLADVFHGNGAWGHIPRTTYQAPTPN